MRLHVTACHLPHCLIKLTLDELLCKLDIPDDVLSSSNVFCELHSSFMNRFTTLKQQCIPKKTVRYNKKVHKDNPWITNGILKSINSKDKLYKALIKTPKESPNYAVLQTNFKIYRKIIRRSIMFAKRDYYRSVFNKYSAT